MRWTVKMKKGKKISGIRDLYRPLLPLVWDVGKWITIQKKFCSIVRHTPTNWFYRIQVYRSFDSMTTLFFHYCFASCGIFSGKRWFLLFKFYAEGIFTLAGQRQVKKPGAGAAWELSQRPSLRHGLEAQWACFLGDCLVESCPVHLKSFIHILRFDWNGLLHFISIGLVRTSAESMSWRLLR